MNRRALLETCPRIVVTSVSEAHAAELHDPLESGLYELSGGQPVL